MARRYTKVAELAEAVRTRHEQGETYAAIYRAHFSSRSELEQLVTEYVDFYNFERIFLKNGLTPVEIRSKAA